MKGIIYSMCTHAITVDLCNKVQPQNIREGAWILLKNYRYFPKGTIFLCVVDPGVGSERKAVAIKTKNYFFVGPDNGLLYPATEEEGIKKIIELSVEDASLTFHGRDVFAKAAAQLEKGVSLEELGEKTNLNTKLEFHLKGREGEIVRIDHFGNIITNIPHNGRKGYYVEHNNFKKKLKFYRTYAIAPAGKLFLIEGSSDTLEISIKNSSAVKKFKAKTGDKIKIL
jgi:hypothetical protein